MSVLSLLVYEGDRLRTAASTLAERSDRAANISGGSCTVRIEDAGVAVFDGEWNLGSPGLLADEFEQAGRLLRSGRPALVRSAIFDASVVPFFYFEPGDAGSTLVSCLFLDGELGMLWPLPSGGPDARSLYDHLASQLERLLSAQPDYPGVLRRVSLPSAALEDDMELLVREARAIARRS